MDTTTRKMINCQVSNDEYEIYKSYAMWTAYQNQFGFYSSIPAYHQISTTPVLLQSPSDYGSGSSPDYKPESPTSARDFKLNCEHCGSVYTSRKRLQNHYEKCIVLNPHLDELIVCKVCKRTFKTNTGYTNHMMRFHSEIANESCLLGQKIMKIKSKSTEDLMVIEIEDDSHQLKAHHSSKSIFHSIDMLAKSDAAAKIN